MQPRRSGTGSAPRLTGYRGGFARSSAQLRSSPIAARRRRAAEVDHFLPWSRHPDNALHNLVVADAACNGDKRDFLASARHVGRWRERNGSGQAALADLARGLDWEAGSERILGTARAVYAQVPEDGRLWEAPRTFVAPDRGALARALA